MKVLNILEESFNNFHSKVNVHILLTKSTAAQNEVALSYHRVRGLYFLAVVFARSIVSYANNNLETTLICYHRNSRFNDISTCLFDTE